MSGPGISAAMDIKRRREAEPKSSVPVDQGFGAMGKPIDFARRQRGYDAVHSMGLSHDDAMRCVNTVADRLERDKPMEAMNEAMSFVDLTGAYRLVAELLTWPVKTAYVEGM